MSVSYDQIRHSVMLRANMLFGSQATTLQSTYATTPLTATQNKSADFPFDHLRETILQAEQDFVNAVAFTGQHPDRQYIRSLTNPLANFAELPTTDQFGKLIVGIFGSVFDTTDNFPCDEAPLDLILRRNRNAGAHYLTPVYYYKIDGGIIRHTRTTVTVECCVYQREAQTTAYNSGTIMLLPDIYESGIVARALSFLFRDGLYESQASIWRGYSDQAIAAIRMGGSSVQPRSIPQPITEGRAA